MIYFNVIKIFNADKPHTWGVFNSETNKCVAECDTKERADDIARSNEARQSVTP